MMNWHWLMMVLVMDLEVVLCMRQVMEVALLEHVRLISALLLTCHMSQTWSIISLCCCSLNKMVFAAMVLWEMLFVMLVLEESLKSVWILVSFQYFSQLFHKGSVSKVRVSVMLIDSWNVVSMSSDIMWLHKSVVSNNWMMVSM